MKPTRTWIVVADGARARVLLNEGPGKGLKPAVAEALEHAPSRARDRELVSDRPGRTYDRGGPGRHSKEPRTDWHRFEKERFAHEVAGMLRQGRIDGSFDRLILVAPPKTLGDLRHELDKPTADRIYAEVQKDLTNMDDRELPKHLEHVIVV